MQFLALFVAVACLASLGSAIGPDVVELTPANFKSKVLDSDDLWIVEFFGLRVPVSSPELSSSIFLFFLQLPGAVCVERSAIIIYQFSDIRNMQVTVRIWSPNGLRLLRR